MSTFEFDKSRFVSMKTCFDALIAKCGEVQAHYKSDGDQGADVVVDMFDQEIPFLTDWRDSCDRVINGNTRHEVTKQSLTEWLSNLQRSLDETTGFLIMFGMDQDLPEAVQKQWQELAEEFEKLDALVSAECEVHR